MGRTIRQPCRLVAQLGLGIWALQLQPLIIVNQGDLCAIDSQEPEIITTLRLSVITQFHITYKVCGAEARTSLRLQIDLDLSTIIAIQMQMLHRQKLRRKIRKIYRELALNIL